MGMAELQAAPGMRLPEDGPICYTTHNRLGDGYGTSDGIVDHACLFVRPDGVDPGGPGICGVPAEMAKRKVGRADSKAGGRDRRLEKTVGRRLLSGINGGYVHLFDHR